jgi:hypothetical protein
MSGTPPLVKNTESTKAVAVPGVEKPPASPPPARFSQAAKEAWASTPDEVRVDVSRMEREFHTGFAKYKTAAERDASLDEFHIRAAKGGTTVKEALSKYVALEDLLRADAVKGLELICKNAGVSLRDIAARVLGQATGNNFRSADVTTEAVTKFAADHPRFDELSEDIVFLIETERASDLAEAYELAVRLNLAPRQN